MDCLGRGSPNQQVEIGANCGEVIDLCCNDELELTSTTAANASACGIVKIVKEEEETWASLPGSTEMASSPLATNAATTLADRTSDAHIGIIMKVKREIKE